MQKYVTAYSKKHMKSTLIALYILNVTDLLFTIILLNTGYYIEANLLMKHVVHNFTASVLFKIILPAFLLFYIYYRLNKASNKQLKTAHFLFTSLTAFYLIINFFHIIWFSLLPIWEMT